MNRPDWTRRFTAVGVVSVVAGALLVALIVILVTSWNWVSGSESGSTTIRNIGLVAGGVLALWLAFWRSKIADRQAAAAQRQADTAQKQSETAELGLLNERYQQGTEMLNSEELSVRLDGIHTLARLAEEHPEQYHVQIMQLFCAFVRHPTKDDGGAAKPDGEERLREDVQAVMTAIGTRGEAGIALEKKKAGFALDLRGADLRGVYLPRGANLSGALLFDANLSNRSSLSKANLSNANLVNAKFMDARLFGAKLMEADLSGAKLMGANLVRADFLEAVLLEANLSGAHLFNARNLTQAQLNEACADEGRSPQLSRQTVDAETGKPLDRHLRRCEGAGD